MRGRNHLNKPLELVNNIIWPRHAPVYIGLSASASASAPHLYLSPLWQLIRRRRYLAGHSSAISHQTSPMSGTYEWAIPPSHSTPLRVVVPRAPLLTPFFKKKNKYINFRKLKNLTSLTQTWFFCILFHKFYHKVFSNQRTGRVYASQESNTFH